MAQPSKPGKATPKQGYFRQLVRRTGKGERPRNFFERVRKRSPKPWSAFKVTLQTFPDVKLIVDRMREVKETEGEMNKLKTKLRLGKTSPMLDARGRLTDGKALQIALELAISEKRVLSPGQLQRLTDRFWDAADAKVREIVADPQFEGAAPETMFYHFRNLCSGQMYAINSLMIRYNEMLERLEAKK